MDELGTELELGQALDAWEIWACMAHDAATQAAQPAPPGDAGPGLVSFKTSDTLAGEGVSQATGTAVAVPAKTHTLERIPARLKRMQGSVRQSAQLLQEEATHGGFRLWALFITLTYAPEHDWQPGQVTAFVKAIREYLRRKRIRARYVWVIELTKHARPHYHVLFFLPHGTRLPKPDVRGWWPWGMTNIQRARSPVGYLTKYASKGVPQMDDPSQTAIPSGARLSGNGGLSQQARRIRTWRLAPAWVRELFTVEDRPIRAPGGGWLSRATGHWEPPRWRLKERAPDWSWIIFEELSPDLNTQHGVT